jgi:diguanylate cyclase (GGDEF)-like protein/PAS domain S-box-containing protein
LNATTVNNPGTFVRWDELSSFEGLPAPVWVFDLERARHVWANGPALQLWRAETMEEFASRDFSDMSSPIRARLTDALEHLHNNEPVTELWTVYPKGVPTTFEARMRGVVLPDGRKGLLFEASGVSLPGEAKRRLEAFRHITSLISLHRHDGAALMRNAPAVQAFGATGKASATDDLTLQLGGIENVRRAMQVLNYTESCRFRARVSTRQGERWHDVEVRRLTDPTSGMPCLLVNAQDVTEAEEALSRLALERELLEMISAGRPAREVLVRLAQQIEALDREVVCAVLLLGADHAHISDAFGPSLPETFARPLVGVPIGSGTGSFASAMRQREPVIATDIASDPSWSDYRDWASSLGLRACCLMPIISSSGAVLGALSAYYRQPREFGEGLLSLLAAARHIATLALEREAFEQDLRRRGEQLQMVMDAMPLSIAYADSDQRYVAVNRGFEQLFNCPREQAIGRHSWEVIGRELFEAIRPRIERVMRGEEVKYERDHVDANGNRRHLEAHYVPQIAEDGSVVGHFGIVRDITEAKNSQRLLYQLANHDKLTSLPNRTLFVERLDEAIRRAGRYGRKVGLLFIDLDRFKNVNDTLGHHSGDALLVACAQRFKQCLRETDTVARLGGDEFTVILPEIGKPEEASVAARRLLAALSNPFNIDRQELFATASVGISIFPDDGGDSATLLRQADIAMYRAKELGRNTFCFYSPEETSGSVELLTIETALRRALERQEFLLHFQPILDLDSMRIVGVETLLRWDHPELGMVPPARFIPLAEETGLIIPIGRWVLDQACREGSQLQDSAAGPLRISVNLSPRQFRARDLGRVIADILGTTGLPPAQLELEVTESSVMEDPESAVEILKALKAMGVSLSIDDFGTGYSSLSQLKRLPIDSLKIDRSFVQGIPADEDDAAIAATIIAMGQRLRLTLVAEGIETPEQLEFLRTRGCQLGQGFLFGKPVPAQELLASLRSVP